MLTASLTLSDGLTGQYKEVIYPIILMAAGVMVIFGSLAEELGHGVLLAVGEAVFLGGVACHSQYGKRATGLQALGQVQFWFGVIACISFLPVGVMTEGEDVFWWVATAGGVISLVLSTVALNVENWFRVANRPEIDVSQLGRACYLIGSEMLWLAAIFTITGWWWPMVAIFFWVTGSIYSPLGLSGVVLGRWMDTKEI